MALDSVEGRIKELIKRDGPITFARFMEMALYSEQGGYYTSLQEGEGDYYTSPTAHPVFGALLALQLEQMWRVMGSPARFVVVEVGSGKGGLGQDILSYAEELNSPFSDSLLYIRVEKAIPSKASDEQVIRAAGLPLHQLEGCVLSNELLDAFPVHRVIQQEGRLKEIYIGLHNEELGEVVDELSSPLIQQQLGETGVSLSEGQQGEVNLRLRPWIEDVGEALTKGFVITIDYGYLAQELYAPERAQGTFRCYFKHTANRQPFKRIGRQDMTAHVDFSALIRLGEEGGLRPCGLITQRQFLTNLGLHAFIDALQLRNMRQSEYYANRMGMQSLLDPQGLGSLRVLMQQKGIDEPQLYGLSPNSPRKAELMTNKKALKVPLLSERHLQLAAAKYPHLGWDVRP